MPMISDTQNHDRHGDDAFDQWFHEGVFDDRSKPVKPRRSRRQPAPRLDGCGLPI
jgi:hypothetical protein